MPPPGRRGYKPSVQQQQKKQQYFQDLAKRRADESRQQQQVAYQAARQRAEAKARENYTRQVQQQRVLAEQQRDAYTAQQESYKARGEAQAKSRLQRAASIRKTHTVTRKDTPESIAQQYGIEPSAVGAMVPSLRPGQRLTFDVPQAIQREDRPMRAAPQAGAEAGVYTGDVGAAWGGIMESAEQFAQYGGVQGQMAKWGMQAMPTVMKALGRFGGLGWGDAKFFGADTGAMGEWGERMTQYGEEMEQHPGYPSFVGAEIQRADLSQYNVARRVPGGIHDQMDATIAGAQQQASLFATSMRYTGQTLATAYEAMIGGDPDWDRFLKDSNGNIVMALTAGDTWDTGPMKDQFSYEMWEKVKEMGFVEMETDLWMVPTIEEFGYGMGDFTFPGYGGGFGGFGGGGGDYEYLSRGGAMRRKKGGGVSSGERYRIFPEGVSPAHWRI